MPAGDPYFNAEAPADLALLPTRIRADEELADLVRVVQADILARYTVGAFEAPLYTRPEAGGLARPGEYGVFAGAEEIADGLWVTLRGYNPDPALADASFREAFRREIGNVLRWRVRHAKRDPDLASEAKADRTLTYRDDAADLFPPTFPMHLRPFEVGVTPWGL